MIPNNITKEYLIASIKEIDKIMWKYWTMGSPVLETILINSAEDNIKV